MKSFISVGNHYFDAGQCLSFAGNGAKLNLECYNL